MLTQNCDCIKVTYTLVGEEPVTVEVVWDGISISLDRPVYEIGELGCALVFSTDSYFPEYPLPLWFVLGGDLPELFQCKLTEGGIPIDTPCPFGTYTIEEDSIFESFIVEPCAIPNPYAESINCYKLAVWSKQCEYSKCVLEYVNNLIFGIDVCKLEESLKEQRRVLEILNCYDPRDILGNTTNYNTITYTKIKQLLNHL